MNKRSKLGFFLFGVVLALAMAAMGDDPDGAQAELRQYCDMVTLHRADPTVGWPDFNESYDRECTHAEAPAR
jgi:hypothetical protein